MTTSTVIRGRFIFEFSTLATLTSVLIVLVMVLVAQPANAEAAPAAFATVAAPGSTPRANWTGFASDPADGGRRLAPLATTDASPSDRIAVDLDDRRQSWIGVGGALTDSSVDLLSSDDDELLATLFAADSRDGARLNMVRLPLSATDFSARPWTWSPAESGEFAPPVEARRAADLMRDVVAQRTDALAVAAPWTAPASMVGGDGALSEDDETAYAELLTTQIDWLRSESVPVLAMTLGNEPGHRAGYPSMTMSDDQMARVGELVKPALERSAVDLWALDHNWADRPRVDRLLEATPGTFDAAAFHCYEGTPDQMSGLDVPAVVTECTGTDDNWTSTFGWDSRVLVAESIRAGSTGLMMWNLVLDPTPDVLPDGCAACRGLLTIDPATGLATPNPEFFLLAHVSRAADPGSVVVTTDQVDRLPTVAFVNPDGTVGIFGHNDTPEPRTVEFQLSDGSSATVTVGPWEMFTLRG